MMEGGCQRKDEPVRFNLGKVEMTKTLWGLPLCVFQRGCVSDCAECRARKTREAPAKKLGDLGTHACALCTDWMKAEAWQVGALHTCQPH